MSERSVTSLSLAALAVAILGWTPLGEAARQQVFPRNSVGTAQLKANAVTSPKIRNGSVRAADIQRSSITAAHVKPGTLLGSSFQAGQLPAGPKGDKGDKGERRATRGIRATRVTRETSVSRGTSSCRARSSAFRPTRSLLPPSPVLRVSGCSAEEATSPALPRARGSSGSRSRHRQRPGASPTRTRPEAAPPSGLTPYAQRSLCDETD